MSSTRPGPGPAQPSVELREVSKRFGEVPAVDRVSLAIRRGEIFSLLGPSGCGKTTLLRLIAGLDAPDAGRIALGGADVTELPAHRRPVHLVFQQYALFPHLTVAGNVAFGLPYRGHRRMPRPDQAARVREALALVRLAGLEDRYPDQLSGGQRQRVALARALVLEPEVLLLDEPLAALDRKLRREMQGELRGLQRALGISFVFVTHDQEEALALSDRVAVMSRGRIEQVGSPAEVYERPETAFVADFLGAGNFFAGEALAAGGGESVLLRLPGGAEATVAAPPGARFRPGQAVRCVVRPERLSLCPDPPAAGSPAVPATVEDRLYQGAVTEWAVRGEGGERWLAATPGGASGEGDDLLAAGRRVFLTWDPRHTVALRQTDQEEPEP